MFNTLGTAHIRVSVSDLEGSVSWPTLQLLIQLKLRLVIVINHNLKMLTLSLMFLNILCENRVRRNTVIPF